MTDADRGRPARRIDGYPKTVVLRDGLHLALRPTGEPSPEGAVEVAALDGERVAGRVRLEPDGRARTAVVRVELAPEFRSRRLGTWLLLEAIHVAAALGHERLRADPGDDAGLREALVRFDFHPAEGGPWLMKRLHHGWPEF